MHVLDLIAPFFFSLGDWTFLWATWNGFHSTLDKTENLLRISQGLKAKTLVLKKHIFSYHSGIFCALIIIYS